ncbi:MAG: hypothetical protein ACLP50_14375 [Solirubrobacteraceae bacterium]
MSFGSQLYVVYDPEVHAGDPPAQAQLKWIQVAQWSDTGSPSPASTFLARDTLTKDAAGEDVIEIYGEIKYGWQLQEVPR